MKPEDIERMYYRYTLFSDAPTVPWLSLSQRARMAFAAMCRACERDGVERAKEHMVPVAALFCGIDWSALDAEIEKENET